MTELDKILQLLKKGDRRGLELLFNHFYKPLVFYAMNFLAQQEEAEDAVQEVFIKFWEGKRFHAIKNSLRPYLYQSVRNYCLNLLQGKKVVLTGDCLNKNHPAVSIITTVAATLQRIVK